MGQGTTPLRLSANLLLPFKPKLGVTPFPGRQCVLPRRSPTPGTPACPRSPAPSSAARSGRTRVSGAASPSPSRSPPCLLLCFLLSWCGEEDGAPLPARRCGQGQQRPRQVTHTGGRLWPCPAPLTHSPRSAPGPQATSRPRTRSFPVRKRTQPGGNERSLVPSSPCSLRGWKAAAAAAAQTWTLIKSFVSM